MEWHEITLMILLCIFFGFVLGYLFRSTQADADAAQREREFFNAVIAEAKKRTPEEAARIGQILAKKMADDILRRDL